MWFDESVFYQIYPLGLCGAPAHNDGVQAHRILQVKEWIPHLQKLGVTAVLFNPVFQSDAHGYDTRDFRALDCRLGTNEDFADVCAALHTAGIRVVLDAVFNHVGRGFWAFADVLEKRWDSPYKDWFHINFDGNSGYNDGLWYEGWEGHYELVKLNLRNPAVVDYLLDTVRFWAGSFGIDGLRLDVAYCLEPDFLRRLRSFTDGLKPEFFLLGEMLHGDYNQRVNDGMLHSCTNYECYKGLYSSFNSMNLFEIAYSLNRQFGPEPWTLYRGKPLLAFADNHDVTRLATILTNPEHIRPLYGLLFAMPGIPCLYYGSEWGIQGDKAKGDGDLRPALAAPQWNGLTDWIASLARARRESVALQRGDYRQILVTNHQLIFQRSCPDTGERVLVAVNAAAEPYVAHFDAQAGCADELISGGAHDFGGGSTLAPYSVAYWRVK